MTLSPQEKQAIIAYRVKKAEETMNEAKIVMESGLWNLAVNRFYYSVFYAALALMQKEGISTTTHRGVWSMLNLHFVKTGILTKEDGSLLARLFTMRHTGDYEDIFDWGEEDAKEFLPKTESLLNKLLSLLS